MIAVTVPGALTRIRHVIDYAGTLLIALAATSFVMLTSLGGTTYAWGSSPIIGLGVLGVVLTVVWALVDRRAAEPVLPLHLFANRTFAVVSAMSFIVGFAMFGATVFLPLFLQYVRGATPTASGLSLLPLMGGLIVTSIGSGQIITRTGRYRRFPIIGLRPHDRSGSSCCRSSTPRRAPSSCRRYMVVLGAGLGCLIQVLVLAAQNAVPHSELGVATSGITFFRTIGAAFGTAIFGAILANIIDNNLAAALGGVALPGLHLASLTPKLLRTLPTPVHHAFVVAYAHSLDIVFLVAVPIAAVAFGLSWLLPEISLRHSTHGAPSSH